jgi:flavodoxin
LTADSDTVDAVRARGAAFTQGGFEMKALVVYDSVHGNTEQVARAIAEALALVGDVTLRRAGEADVADMASVDLLIVGSPTHGGKPTPAVQEFLGKIPSNALANVRVAAFDTRVKNFVATLFGYAAGRIGTSLQSKGGRLAVEPEGFLVKGSEGPLEPGEAERAAGWAKRMMESNK